jgi:hypothetical protein
MFDDPHLDSINRGGQGSGGQDSKGQDPGPQEPGRQDGPPPVSPHVLTWWFGLMAIGGVAFGLEADEHPFGRGALAHPLVVFASCVLASLLTLHFLNPRPVTQLISARSLVAGVVIGAACFFLGRWFGASLMHMP